jgi:hypothetical protein
MSAAAKRDNSQDMNRQDGTGETLVLHGGQKVAQKTGS